MDAFPFRVEFAPARHAVDVHHDLAARQLVELVPSPGLLLLDQTGDLERPVGESLIHWYRTIVQHREFLGKRLARRQAACALYFFFPLAAFHEILEHVLTFSLFSPFDAMNILKNSLGSLPICYTG